MVPLRLATLEEAKQLKETIKALVMAEDIPQACVRSAWLALSFRSLGETTEALHVEVMLAWAQDMDGRPWQAVRTMERAMADPAFQTLPRWIRARAHLSHARASWSIGDLTVSSEHAARAYALADDPLEQGRAALAVAQVSQHMGRLSDATAHFKRAVEIDPSLDLTAYSIRAYLLNLAGNHRKALREAEAGLVRLMHHRQVSDDTSRAAEETALLVELAIAKAFMRRRDARDAVLTAQAALQKYQGSSELEFARTRTAQSLTLIAARELNAAETMLADAVRVFRQRRAIPELDLTTVVARRLSEAREVS